MHTALQRKQPSLWPGFKPKPDGIPSLSSWKERSVSFNNIVYNFTRWKLSYPISTEIQWYLFTGCRIKKTELSSSLMLAYTPCRFPSNEPGNSKYHLIAKNKLLPPKVSLEMLWPVMSFSIGCIFHKLCEFWMRWLLRLELYFQHEVMRQLYLLKCHKHSKISFLIIRLPI